jgi:hypothetical protein
MLPPANDLIALLGINLVVSAGCLRLLSWRHGVTSWSTWISAAVFLLLWCPVGPARLPIVAYVRGISSDLSISLVAIACLGMYQRLRGIPLMAQRERMRASFAFAAGALFLYPLALGWGDWDAYRLGWGSWGLWATLLALSLVCWARGLRLLPVLVALALLAWTMGALESTNLWDYLIDPWLAIAAIFQSIKSAVGWGLARLRSVSRGSVPSST